MQIRIDNVMRQGEIVMKIKIFIYLTIFFISITSYVFAESSLFGLTPEQISEISKNRIKSEQDTNALLLKILKEKQRIKRERARCTLLGNVEGATMDEAKEIARQMGANSIRWINVSKHKTTAQALNCP